MANNEFDKFLSEREATQNQTRSTEEVVVQGATAEWQNLKDATKALTSGKTIEVIGLSGNLIVHTTLISCS